MAMLPVSRPGGKTAAAVASPDPESSASEADSSGSGDILEVTEVPAPNGVRPRRAAAQAAGKAISNTYNPGSDPEEEEEAVHGSGSEADEQPEEADPLMLLAKAAETNARAAPPKPNKQRATNAKHPHAVLLSRGEQLDLELQRKRAALALQVTAELHDHPGASGGAKIHSSGPWLQQDTSALSAAADVEAALHDRQGCRLQRCPQHLQADGTEPSRATVTEAGNVMCRGCNAFTGSPTAWEDQHLGSRNRNAPIYTYLEEEQDLAILCQDIDLSLISCLYCCTSNTGVPLITCKTCPCSFHQACYESKANDQVPMDDDDWQCISCRQGSDCACSWCQKYMPQQAETIDMDEEFKKLQQSVLQVAPGTPPPPARTAPPINPTAPSPEPHLPSSGGAGPSRRAHTPPAPAPAPIPAPTPASGGGAAADGLDLSKLAAGDWRLPDWTHLSGAARALVTLLDKAGSPDGLLLQLDEGIKRLKRLQRADSTAEAVSDFEEGYTWLQVWGKKRAQAQRPGKVAEHSRKFEEALRQLIKDAVGPTEP